MSELRSRVDRIRIEIERDGRVEVVELVGYDAEKVQLSLDLEAEERDLPPAAGWRKFETSGRVRVRLDAFGITARVSGGRGEVGESGADQPGATRSIAEETAGQSKS